MPATRTGTLVQHGHQSDAERRQLTIVFCDLVGSTALSGRLDPEDFRDVLSAYRDACARVIARYDGYIGKFLGDGLLVYFGYPLAHEDDARRAVRAALEIVTEVGRLGDRLQREKALALGLQTRIGIHTGLVVAGDMGSGDAREADSALGEPVNVAARIVTVAAPDSVVVSAATRRLIEGYVVCRPLGRHELKGVVETVELHVAEGETEVRSRIEEGPVGELVPLVGREPETAVLLHRWKRVRDGQGQVVSIAGDPGIGKSRLVYLMREKAANDTSLHWQGYCSPYYQNTAFYPVIDAFRRAAGFERTDTAVQRIDKLERVVSRYLPRPDAVPLLASLLSLPVPERYAQLELTPQQRKQKTFEVLLALLFGAAAHEPLLLIVEDLQWVDPSTLELLNLLLDQIRDARILCLLTFRPEFVPPWTDRAHVTRLALRALSDDDVAQMLAHLARGKALPAEVVDLVTSKADGVPLFVEEVTKMVLESSVLRDSGGRYELTSSVQDVVIPSSVQDLLTARLDRLATAKPVAQLGATLGRTFTFQLIHAVSAVSAVDEPALQAELQRLVDADILHCRGHGTHATYLFRHALIQDAAYHSLLKSTRRIHHRRIADVLAERFPETEPELIAHHYTEAGAVDRAIPYWREAGQRATQRSANTEAIAHLTKGLDLVRMLPESETRSRLELSLQIALTGPLIATKGYAASEMQTTVARALELCHTLGETKQIFPVLYGQWAVSYATGHAEKGHDLATEFLRLAERHQDDGLHVMGHRLVGHSAFVVGKLLTARTHAEEAIARYDPARHRALAFLYGTDPKVMAEGVLVSSLWQLGYADQSRAWIQRALEDADVICHVNTTGYAMIWCAAFPYVLCRDSQRARAFAERAVAFADDNALPLWKAWGRVFLACALVEQGLAADAIAMHREAMGALQAQHFNLLRAAHLVWLARAHGAAGRREEGLELLVDAQDVMASTGERWLEADAYRIRGELLRGLGGTHAADAEAAFREAVRIAHAQGAKTLELRAATSLARLWAEHGQEQAAQRLLAPLWGWFSEGFDTPDLREAKELIDRLGEGGRATL